VPCSNVDTGPSTTQSNGTTRQGSREENLPVCSSDGSTINISESEDFLSLQSRFRYLHKATKNPLSGLDLSRTNLPPNIRKLLSKRCTSDAKDMTDGEAISSSCQTLQRTNDNDDVFGMTGAATQGQSLSHTSSIGTTIESASGSIAMISSRPENSVEVHSAGISHTVTAVSNTVFSHNTISLQSPANSNVDSATEVAGTSSRNQSLNVDGPTRVNKESYVTSETLACTHGGTSSSDSSSMPSVTLDKHRSLLALSSMSGICLQIPKPTTLSTSHEITDGTLSCTVYTLPKERPSFVSLGLSTYTVSASLSDVRDGTYHHAVELHKNNANGIRDIYRVATSTASSLAQTTSSSQKQVDNANVSLSAKRQACNATTSNIVKSGPIVNDSFLQRGTLVPITTVTNVTGVFSLDERSVQCLDSEITQAVDTCKMTTTAQTSSSLFIRSNVSESRTTDGEKTGHGQKSQNKHSRKKGSEREIAKEQVLAEENSQCTKSKEDATFLADSAQPKANVYRSNSSLEVDSGQRTMLRTFFNNLRKKKENRKEKEIVHGSRKASNDGSTFRSTAVANVDTSLLLGNEVDSMKKSNEAFSKMEGGHQSCKKDRQSMKRKVIEAESSEFKRRRVEKGHNEEYENLKKKEAKYKVALERTRKTIKGVKKQILSLEEILQSCYKNEKKIESMLEKVSKKKHKLRVASDEVGSKVGSLSRTPSKDVSSNYSSCTETCPGKCGSDESKEKERISGMELDSTNDLSTGSDYMFYNKEASKKAKKKKWKNHRKKAFGNNFSDMLDTGLNNNQDKVRTTIVRTPSALTDANAEVTNSIQTSSFEKTDSFVIKRSVFEESEISGRSSKALPWTGKAVSSVSTPSLERPNDLCSRAVTGGTNKASE